MKPTRLQAKRRPQQSCALRQPSTFLISTALARRGSTVAMEGASTKITKSPGNHGQEQLIRERKAGAKKMKRFPSAVWVARLTGVTAWILIFALGGWAQFGGSPPPSTMPTQLPLSGRSGQSGGVAATESPSSQHHHQRECHQSDHFRVRRLRRKHQEHGGDAVFR